MSIVQAYTSHFILPPNSSSLCTIVENLMQVVYLDPRAKAMSRAKMSPITLSHTRSQVVDNGHEEKGGDWAHLVSPSTGDGSCERK